MGGIVPGLDQEHVISVDDVLGGQTDIGHRVVVLDRNGHWESCGTAEYLLERDHSVDLITPFRSPVSTSSQATLRSFRNAFVPAGCGLRPTRTSRPFPAGRSPWWTFTAEMNKHR